MSWSRWGADRLASVRSRPVPDVATAATTVLAVGWSAWLAGRSWLYYDDFANLTIAGDSHLGWAYLSRDVFGHFSPGLLLPVWLVAHLGHGVYAWAALTTVAWFAALLVLVAKVARALGGRGWAVTAAVAVTAVNVAWDPSLLWWAAQLNTIPVAVGGLLLLLGHLRFEAGQRRGRVTAVLGLSLALACSEGSVVFLVPVAAVTAGWLVTGTAAERARAMAQRWRTWLAYVAPVVVLLLLRSLHTYGDQSPSPSAASLAAFPWWFVTKGFAPAQFGWTIGRFALLDRGLVTAAVASLALAACVAWFVRRVGPPALVAVGALAVMLVGRAWMVGWARLGLLGQLAATEPRYVADLVWVGPVLAVGAWSRRAPGRPVGRPVRVVDVWFPQAAVPVAVVIVLGLVGQAAALHNGQTLGSRAYLDRFRSSLAAAREAARPTGATVSVLDTAVPAEVLGPQFGEFVFVSRTIDFGVEGVAYNVPGALLSAPDADGTLRPVRLDRVSEVQLDQAFTATGAPALREVRPHCWRAGASATVLWLPLSVPLASSSWVLDLDVTLSGPRPDQPALGGRVPLLAAGREPLRAIVTSAKGVRPGRWLLAAHPFAASQIGFQLAPRQQACVRAGAILAPNWSDR